MRSHFRNLAAPTAALALVLSIVAWARRAADPVERKPGLTFHFRVTPGEDPGRLRLDLAGVAMVELDRSGDLILHVGSSTVRQAPPLARQDDGAGERDVPVRFRMTDDGQVGFIVGAFDRQHPLEISSATVPQGK